MKRSLPYPRRRPIVAALLIVGALAVLVVASPKSYSAATEDQYQQLINSLGAHGTIVERLTPGETLVTTGAAVPAQVAVDSAVREYGKARTPVVYEAYLTMPGYEPAIERRPVYVVQLTGLRLPPMGGNKAGENPDESRIHQELVVFIDASSGDLLLAQTVR